MLSLLALPVLTLAPALPQERIFLTSGKILEVRRVTAETFEKVEYETESRARGSKDAAEVVKIEHDLSSPALDDYVAGLALMEEQGDFAGAIGAFDVVLEDQRLMNNRRLWWVKPYALWNRARCLAALQDPKGVQETVDQLLREVPDTFFYAPALMLKAETTAAAGDPDLARGFYRDLARAVDEKGLPEKWRAWSELGLLLLDDKKTPATRQRELQAMAEKFRGVYDDVASRAEVEVGNAMVQAGDYAQAEGFFRRILESGHADDRTRAAAWAGLGDCAFQRGLKALETDTEKAREAFREAALAHLRVATLHRDVRRIVPRSLYYAAVALDRMGEAERRSEAITIVRRLSQAFPNSSWTDRALTDLRLKRG